MWTNNTNKNDSNSTYTCSRTLGFKSKEVYYLKIPQKLEYGKKIKMIRSSVMHLITQPFCMLMCVYMRHAQLKSPKKAT